MLLLQQMHYVNELTIKLDVINRSLMTYLLINIFCDNNIVTTNIRLILHIKVVDVQIYKLE